MATHKYRRHHPLVLLLLPNECVTGRCSWWWWWLVAGATMAATATVLMAVDAVGKTPPTSVVTIIVDHPNRLLEGGRGSHNDSRRQLPQEQQKRIVGGKPVATADKLPAFAFAAGTKLCGATVIHPDVLLSAAHCEGAFRKDGVLIGGVSISGLDTDEFVGVVLEKLHPQYQPGSEQNDIMLVKLDRPIDTPLVKYNVNASIPGPSDELKIVGFGRTSTNGTSASTLQQIEVRVVSNDECKTALQAHGLVLDGATMLCSSTTR